MSRFNLFRVSVFIALCSFSLLFAQNKMRKVTAVIPLECIDVPVTDGAKLTRLLTEKIAAIPEYDVIQHEKVNDAVNDTSVLKDSTCRNRVCQLAVAKRLYAELAYGGSVYKTNGKLTLSINLIDVKNNSVLWTKDYSCECDIENFSLNIPEMVALESRKAVVQQGTEAAAVAGSSADLPMAATSVVDNSQSKDAPVIIDNNNADEIDEDDEGESSDSYVEPAPSERKRNGTVESPVIGVNGRIALGDVGHEESKWGAEAMVVVPTGKVSHLRVRYGVPTSSSAAMTDSSDLSFLDMMLSLEHEWGFRNFGITFGAAWMRMPKFSKTETYQTYYNYSYVNSTREMNYKTANCYDWVLGIRGGTPNRGFRGRIVYPMPFTIDEDRYNNFFVEYSAIGMFGNDKVKGGVGVQGVFKRRAGYADKPDYYGYRDSVSTREYYFMGPAGKISCLLGEHSVVTFGIDVLGLFMPDPDEDDSNGWSPNVSLGYTFSIAPLKRVDSYDGKF